MQATYSQIVKEYKGGGQIIILTSVFVDRVRSPIIDNTDIKTFP